MKRNALQELLKWKDNDRRKPLIVWGARQVGKTYLVRDIFAETCYKDNYVYIDCKIEDEVRDFCSETANAGKMIEYISLFKGRRITPDTLLIFDEVQECPNIISALKYFCQDFREIPVIATGSMVRIKIQREIYDLTSGRPGGNLRVVLHPLLAEAVKQKQADIEENIHRSLKIQSDPQLAWEDYKIVLE